MRKFLTLTAAVCFGLILGCGDNAGINKTPLTDEQKKQIAVEDQRTAEEESQGSVNKKKAKK
jgi:hypothetical protein